MLMNSKILATGAYLPANVVTNRDLEKIVDTTDQWIRERSGILQRHVAAPHEDSSTMAYEAAMDLLKGIDFDANNIDAIIIATCTPVKFMPSTACILQEKLGIANCIAFDINAACSGFMYALSCGNSFIKTGIAKNVLVIGSETMTKLLDWEDRSTCILFGDGAGAILLQGSEEEGILDICLGSDGKSLSALETKGTIISHAASSFIEMNGREVFKRAVKKLEETVGDIFHKTHYSAKDIDWLVPHQANKRIIEATAGLLKMPLEQIILTVDKHANTSAASIPLAMHEGILSNKIQRGDTLLLEAFGAGYTWGSAIIKY